MCLPVPIGESLPAGLTIYSTQRGAFESEELQLLEELAQDLGYGIRMLRMRAEREQAEERLQEQQFYTRSLIEASLDPLVTISREGKITDVNQATETVTGATREELIGSDFCDYFTEPAKARAGYEQVFADGYVQDYALAVRHASGRLTDVLYNASVFRNRKGEAEGVFAAARDITERKRAEERVVRAGSTAGAGAGGDPGPRPAGRRGVLEPRRGRAVRMEQGRDGGKSRSMGCCRPSSLNRCRRSKKRCCAGGPGKESWRT